MTRPSCLCGHCATCYFERVADAFHPPRPPLTPRELGDAMRGEFSPSASSVQGPVR